MTLRVVLADDHPVVRRGLRALLTTIDGIEVVGEAADGEAAVKEAQLLAPDIVLMDVRMPGLDGVEATRRIRSAVPGVAVLVLTMFDDDATVFTAMRAGARGYLLKDARGEEMLLAIFDLMDEGLVMGGSTGINVAAAIRMAQDLGPGHTVVTVLCDHGQRYQSKIFNPAFLRERDLPVPAWME